MSLSVVFHNRIEKKAASRGEAALPWRRAVLVSGTPARCLSSNAGWRWESSRHLLRGLLVGRDARGRRARRCRKRSHLAEQRQGAVPGREQVPRAWAQRLREMLLHEGQELPFLLRLQRTGRGHFRGVPGVGIGPPARTRRG